MITVVGSLNMDLFVETPTLPRPGETVIGTRFRQSCGGKGANQAVTIARLGARVALIGAVGDDAFGTDLARSVAASGVNTAAIVRRIGVASGVALIVVDAKGQNLITVAPGANATLSPDDLRPHRATIQSSKALLAPLETPLATVQAAFQIARSVGVPTFLNPAPACPLPPVLAANCDWLMPNETEASRLTGLPVKDAASAAAASCFIRTEIGVPNVLITLGAQGAWLDGREFSGHVAAFRVRAIDTVGAGDTFIGAFVTRLTEGANPEQAARFASAAAAVAVKRRGAQESIPQREEVEEFLRIAV